MVLKDSEPNPMAPFHAQGNGVGPLSAQPEAGSHASLDVWLSLLDYMLLESSLTSA